MISITTQIRRPLWIKNHNVTAICASLPQNRKTGDSVRRQTEAAERWASENGFTLDDSLKMEDLGLSAFHGKNIEPDAALGSFLANASNRDCAGSVLFCWLNPLID
jgi:hypothetical protein